MNNNDTKFKIGDVILYKDTNFAYISDMHTDTLGMTWYNVVFQTEYISKVASIKRTTIPHDMAIRYMRKVP